MGAPTNKTSEQSGDGYDIFSHEYGQDPHSYWASLASSSCPIAKTSKWGGSWMLINYKDVCDAIQDPERFSSRAVEAAGEVPAPGREFYMPPVTSPPSEHSAHRDIIAPFLAPRSVQKLEPLMRIEARRLASSLAQRGGGDAAADFARPLTLSVLMQIFDCRQARTSSSPTGQIVCTSESGHRTRSLGKGRSTRLSRFLTGCSRSGPRNRVETW